MDSRECSNAIEQKFSTVKPSEQQPPEAVVDEDMRKKILNAPKRMKKIEDMLAILEEEAKMLDEAIIQVLSYPIYRHCLILTYFIKEWTQ